MDAALVALIVVPIGAAYVAAITYAIVRVVGTRDLSAVEKIIWSAAIIYIPLIAAVTWYFAGPHPFRQGLPRA